MACRITIKRKIEWRDRRKDDTKVLIFTGMAWRSVGKSMRPASMEKYYEPHQHIVATAIEFLPSNVIPLSKLYFERHVRPKLRAQGLIR